MRLNDREIQKNKAYTFTFNFYNRGKKVPTSCTLSITSPGGTALVSDVSATISADGTCTYELPASKTGTEDRHYKIDVEALVDGDTIRHSELFDIVHTPIKNLTSDSDLYIWLPDLRSKVYERKSKTTADGTTTTLIDADLISDGRDFTNGVVEIYTSDSEAEICSISSYDVSTGTITFDRSLGNAVESGTRYAYRDAFYTLREQAYNIVLDLIRIKVGLAAGYLDSNTVRRLIVFQALKIYCQAARENEGDKWSLRFQYFDKIFDDEYSAFIHAYDFDEDGKISEYEDDSKPTFYNVRGIM